MKIKFLILLFVLILPCPVSVNAAEVLEFYATWCGPCKEMEKVVKDSKIKVIKIDVDKQKQFAKKYKVDKIPTFIAITPNGDELGRVTGKTDKTTLQKLNKLKKQ